MARDAFRIGWIAPLAEPYLRGYQTIPQEAGSLRGYWFLRPPAGRVVKRGRTGAPSSGAGFFVGYLLEADEFMYLSPEVPECAVFAFAAPPGGTAHRRLVAHADSLLRKTFAYIRWLTHRPPRFEFYEEQLAALVRHTSLREWPRAKYEHYSRNFFIETLAWLVRSGLVCKLLEDSPTQRFASRAVGAQAR